MLNFKMCSNNMMNSLAFQKYLERGSNDYNQWIFGGPLWHNTNHWIYVGAATEFRLVNKIMLCLTFLREELNVCTWLASLQLWAECQNKCCLLHCGYENKPSSADHLHSPQSSWRLKHSNPHAGRHAGVNPDGDVSSTHISSGGCGAAGVDRTFDVNPAAHSFLIFVTVSAHCQWTEGRKEEKPQRRGRLSYRHSLTCVTWINLIFCLKRMWYRVSSCSARIRLKLDNILNDFSSSFDNGNFYLKAKHKHEKFNQHAAALMPCQNNRPLHCVVWHVASACCLCYG